MSSDLIAEFPEMKGFSKRNLELMRQWYLFYNVHLNAIHIAKQPVSQFDQGLIGIVTRIPWGHNIKIITKCKNTKEALFYVNNTIKHNWSRSVLEHQIESCLWQREGAAITNFTETLPKNQSDLAIEMLKDLYIFDFLSLSKEHNERDLELGLIKHITSFLLELGAGFAYIGRQFQLQVGERDFYIDLLFFNRKLKRLIAIDLKIGNFKAEYKGQMELYLRWLAKFEQEVDEDPPIGIILCTGKKHEQISALDWNSLWVIKNIDVPMLEVEPLSQ